MATCRPVGRYPKFLHHILVCTADLPCYFLLAFGFSVVGTKIVSAVALPL